jgi:type 1 fimbriae regulatory protein FimB/type 1 fimbriae regulatory protein FimE
VSQIAQLPQERLVVYSRRASQSSCVFTTEQGSPMGAAGFRKQLARWGMKAKLRFSVNPHILRHACGHALANKGMDTRSLQAYLGHASITHTVRYTEMNRPGWAS